MIGLRYLAWTMLTLAWLAGAAAPALAEAVGVRAARTDDYGRIVFVWQTPVTHDLAVEGKTMTVRFGRPIEASYQRVLGALRNYIAAARPGADGKSVTFRLKGEFEAYSFDSGRTVIVEIAKPQRPKAKPPAETAVSQAESAVAVVRRQVAAQEAASGALPTIRVRSGQHPDYSRIVFDWREAVDYAVDTKDGVVRVTFQRAADMQVGDVNQSPPPFVGGIRARPAGKTTVVTLTVPQSSQIKHFLSGPKVVLDVRRPTGNPEVAALPPEPAAAPAATPAEPAPAQASAARVRSLRPVRVPRPRPRSP